METETRYTRKVLPHHSIHWVSKRLCLHRLLKKLIDDSLSVRQLKDFISRRKREAKSQQKRVENTQVLTKNASFVKVDVHPTVTLEPRSSSDESVTPTKESSSSSGNVGPTTPSPERPLFFNQPDANVKQEVDLLGGMDPHLANLLSNLDMSASIVSNHSVTTNATNSVAMDAVENERLSNRGVSPSMESVSSTSIYPAPTTSNGVSHSQPSSRESSRPSSAAIPTKTLSHKRSKHIALLDSVVEGIESISAESSPLRANVSSQQGLLDQLPPVKNGGSVPMPSSVPGIPYPYDRNHSSNIPPVGNITYSGPQGQPSSLGPYRHHTSSSINFPTTGRGVSPVYLDPYRQAHTLSTLLSQSQINNPVSNPCVYPPRPITSQSQAQIMPPSHPLAPHGIPPALGMVPQTQNIPPPLGLQTGSSPRVPLPGTQQSQLLALLSPRSRAISQPQPPIPIVQQTPHMGQSLHPAPAQMPPTTNGQPSVPVRQSIFNSFLNGASHSSVPSSSEIPPMSLTSPLLKKREVAPNAQLLSILKGGALPILPTHNHQASNHNAPSTRAML